MKEAQIFENWIQNLSEGTWALPETPEQMEKLNQLMSGELIVGPDATNATEQLYDIVGDDELFDILNDLADRSEGRANVWDDSDVQRRLAELGIQTPQSTEAEPSDVEQDTAPEIKEGEEADSPKYSMSNPGKLSNQEYKDQMNRRYGQPDMDTSRLNKAHQDFYDKNPSFKQSGKQIVSPGDGRLASKVVPAVSDTKVGRIPMNTFGDKQSSKSNVPTFLKKDTSVPGMEKLRGPVDVMTDPLNMMPKSPKWPERTHENADLARMLKYAGVPVNEGILTDSTGSTLEHIKDTYKRDIKDFTQTGEMSKHLYHALHDYYFDDMPYGARTGDDIDPHEWISDRFAEDLGMNENLISPMIMPVNEGSCNMTAEGAYCPEHGLAECGGMYEDDSIPRVEISGLGYDDANLAGEKFVNPIQPRRHNELSPLDPGDSTSHPPVAHVDLTMDEGVNDPDYRGGYNNEFDELEDLLSKSGMSQDDLMRQRFLASKYGLNTPADMAKLPALKKDAEAGYTARKAALDADLEKRNQQYLQDKLTDLEYQQDPVAFLKRRTQQLSPTAPTAPTAPTEPTAPALNIVSRHDGVPPPAPSAEVPATEPGVDYSLPRAKLGSSPSMKLPNFRTEPAADVPAPAQLDTRNQKSSIFQQLAQLRNQTRGNMAENSNDDPINSNSAMTGAYYEGKETPTQEGDALLARIKSLALLK